MVQRRLRILISTAVLTAILAAAVGGWMYTARATRTVNTDLFGVAISGYDTVAYFTEGRPLLGSKEYEVQWSDARWRFASAEHRDRFLQDPARYAPQYGGFCASYLAEGGLAGVDPKAWVIIDGKLYLNWSDVGREELVSHPEQSIRTADANWQRHLQDH